jgi:hypothetical protein
LSPLLAGLSHETMLSSICGQPPRLRDVGSLLPFACRWAASWKIQRLARVARRSSPWREIGMHMDAHNQGFAQDLFHGSGAAPAPHVAAEATVDLMCAQRLHSCCRRHVPYLAVAQYIA